MDERKFESFLLTKNKETNVVSFLEQRNSFTIQKTQLSFLSSSCFHNSELTNPLNEIDFSRVLRHYLLVKEFSVRIYRYCSERDEFSLTAHVTPEDTGEVDHFLFRSVEETSGVVLSIYEGKKIGLCAKNETIKLLSLEELDHDENLLRSALFQCSPEFVLTSSESLKALMSKFKIPVKLVSLPISKSSSGEIIGSLKGIALEKDIEENLLTRHDSLRAFELMFSHFKMDISNETRYLIRSFSSKEIMILDSQALKGLHVIPKNNESSLLKILNHCRTPSGDRLLNLWIRQPLYDTSLINERLSVVEVLTNDSELRDNLHGDLLRKIPDFEKLSVKLSTKKGSLADLYKIYLGVLGVRKIASCIMEPLSEIGTELGFLVDKMKGFMSMLESSLDFDSFNEHNDYLIQSSFDEGLERLKGSLDDIKSSIDALASKTLSDLSFSSKSSFKLETSSNFGFYFRVTLKDEIFLRKNKNVIIIDSAKNGVKFTTETLAEFNSEYLTLKNEYLEKQRIIQEELFEIAFGYSRFLRQICEKISKLDVLVSFSLAAVSAPIPYVKPEIKSSKDSFRQITFLSARHPILELQNSNFIPNDLRFDDKMSFMILTGPNLGGKSTYMRTMALCVIMAQIGSFVPCSFASLTPVDKILVRIGAGDSQMEGISTFMSEMLESASLLASSTSSSLVIIDEIGRGTSTYDGLGIAWAIANKILQSSSSFTIFATHFFELTKLAASYTVVSNYHVKALTESSKLTLLYSVLPGHSDKSFGLQVAHLAQFPSDVLQDAKSRLESYEKSLLLDSLLSLSEEHYKDMEDLLEENNKEGCPLELKKRKLSELKEKMLSKSIWKNVCLGEWK